MMNERESFIIEDLDDHHVVIKAEQEYRVRKELETEVCPLLSAQTLELIIRIVGEEYVQSRDIKIPRCANTKNAVGRYLP